MPWNEVKLMTQRKHLIEGLLLPGINVSEICKTRGISRKTAYKWLKRYHEGGFLELADRSRKPNYSPLRVIKEIEDLVIQAHFDHPYWGPRKLRNFLMHQASYQDLPAPSTFSRILKRNDCEVIKSEKSAPATKRFERKEPNELWQMDFKGSFMTRAHRCFPLTIIDDYSRYSIGLQACGNERLESVKTVLINCFQQFGQPRQINVDNGNPWGNSHSDTPVMLTIWLIKHGIRLSHSSPYHPQTNGKDERFHRTLKLEVLYNKLYESCVDVQKAFDLWQHEYNYLRPHDALNGRPPVTRYCLSSTPYEEKTLPYDYNSGEVVRKVHSATGLFRFKGLRFRAGKGLCGEYISIRETSEPDEFSIFFIDTFIKKFKLEDGL